MCEAGCLGVAQTVEVENVFKTAKQKKGTPWFSKYTPILLVNGAIYLHFHAKNSAFSQNYSKQMG